VYILGHEVQAVYRDGDRHRYRDGDGTGTNGNTGTDNGPTQAPNLNTDEDGTPLPEGVKRQTSNVKLGDVDPTLKERYRHSAMCIRKDQDESDYDFGGHLRSP